MALRFHLDTQRLNLDATNGCDTIEELVAVCQIDRYGNFVLVWGVPFSNKRATSSLLLKKLDSPSVIMKRPCNAPRFVIRNFGSEDVYDFLPVSLFHH